MYSSRRRECLCEEWCPLATGLTAAGNTAPSTYCLGFGLEAEKYQYWKSSIKQSLKKKCESLKEKERSFWEYYVRETWGDWPIDESEEEVVGFAICTSLTDSLSFEAGG